MGARPPHFWGVRSCKIMGDCSDRILVSSVVTSRVGTVGGFSTVSTEALGDHVGHQAQHGSEGPGASLPKSSSAAGRVRGLQGLLSSVAGAVA